jgi:2-polyprenyl-3-methyl-5-hydroxy-6-metoxy-1,4-benzoquinol methylase
MTNDEKIRDSWRKNASPWIKTIKDEQIESRRLVTNQAIIDTLCTLPQCRILDIGCGEGWLIRELSSRGYFVTGIDATAELIEKAKALKSAQYHVLTYEGLSPSTLSERYDAAVCNFSLLGKDSVIHVFNTLPQILNEGGYFVIQTLHPCFSGGDAPYTDGWREGSWEGFSNDFIDPAPWYFRTLATWTQLFIANGFEIKRMLEPVNPKTGKVASLIIVGRLAV